MSAPRPYRAGESLEDSCRVCKTDRLHTVVVVDASGRPIRVTCDYCHSEHNYRGASRLEPSSGVAALSKPRDHGRALLEQAEFPLVSERERIAAPMSPAYDTDDLELLLRRIIREEAGVTPVAPAAKWRGGSLVLRPGTPGVQEKSWPIETFFHKVVMLRNRLRSLEQHVNASELPGDVKLKLQAYVSGCYGSLTSFNVLFADENDQFKGSGGE